MNNEKKNNITEMVFILDRSGSMQGLEKDTIGGFNSMIEKQKELDGECYVSTILFDDRSEVLHDRVKLSCVPKMTEKDYFVRGSTALLDAVGGAIHHIGNIHKYARPSDVPAKTIFVITTDGMENASRYYSAYDVKRMIEKEKEKYGWEFLFIGANIDAGLEAEKIGIDRNRSVNYTASPRCTANLYNVVEKTVRNYRQCSVIDENWSEDIE
ncbi:MAG: VWA domain-containing protein [Ruminococcaceae bacterium]|nr:VWA domain-containing protein [Oscillospiraceae bacterium]